MIYIYESHLGGCYTTTEEQDDEILYCDTCGDSNWYIGCVATEVEAEKIIKEYEKGW